MSHGLKGAPGFMTPAMRIAWRDYVGDLPAMIDASREELQAGRLVNAWVGYQIALNQWLRIQSGSIGLDEDDGSGKLRTVRYLRRCQRQGRLDRWTLRVIEYMAIQPGTIEAWHVDALAAVVTALTLERGRKAPRMTEAKRPGCKPRVPAVV